MPMPHVVPTHPLPTLPTIPSIVASLVCMRLACSPIPHASPAVPAIPSTRSNSSYSAPHSLYWSGIRGSSPSFQNNFTSVQSRPIPRPIFSKHRFCAKHSCSAVGHCRAARGRASSELTGDGSHAPTPTTGEGKQVNSEHGALLRRCDS